MTPWVNTSSSQECVEYIDTEGNRWRRRSNGAKYEFYCQQPGHDEFRPAGHLRRLGVKSIEVVHRAYLAHGRGKEKRA